jgi:hypothetical protein
MNITETIRRLEDLRSDYGDLEVSIVSGHGSEVYTDDKNVYAWGIGDKKTDILFDLGI